MEMDVPESRGVEIIGGRVQMTKLMKEIVDLLWKRLLCLVRSGGSLG